jgi:type VI protein secretion system component Hcp
MLLQAVVTGEVFHTAQIVERITGETGRYIDINLTNVALPAVQDHAESGDTHELEEVELAFQKITISDIKGKISSTDSWVQSG